MRERSRFGQTVCLGGIDRKTLCLRWFLKCLAQKYCLNADFQMINGGGKSDQEMPGLEEGVENYTEMSTRSI